MIKVNYLCESSLNSELIIVNNLKKLKNDASLFNDNYIDEILELRKEYEKLDQDESIGLQKTKRDIRNRIRDLSTDTYVYRDENIFGEMVLQIIDNILKRPNFSGYSYKNEMKSLAVEHILKYTYKFESYKQSKISNQYVSSFTYLSTIIFNAFVATINKQASEHQKAREEFIETQKLQHRDHNESRIGENHSIIEKTIILNEISENIFNELSNIELDCKDILIKYPSFYKISLDEYDKIIKWSSVNKVNLSISPYEINLEN